jgi:hypothetical protein
MEMHVPAAVLEARHMPAVRSREDRIEFEFTPQMQVYFERSTRAMWSRWAPEPRPCFNPSLLSGIRSYYDFLAETGGRGCPAFSTWAETSISSST